MKRDPYIRYPEDPAPVIPGLNMRFRWPDRYDDDVRRLRERMQEGGRGLYVLRTPQGDRALVEAYYPDEISAEYYESFIPDTVRRMDFGMGRLVVVGDDLGPGRRPLRWSGELPMSVIAEMRRNNRASRRDLKRQATPAYHKLDMEDRRTEDEQAAFDRWTSWYEEAMKDTVRLAMTPHIYT